MKANLRAVCAAVGAFAALWTAPAMAQQAQELMDQLSQAGRAAFQMYAAAEPNKAFAVGPEGAWGWQAGAQTPEQAQILARQRCEERIQARCVVVDAQTGPVAQAPGAQQYADQGIVRMEMVPTMSDAGREAFQSFMEAKGTKAFAASPSGAWGWQASGRDDLEQVAQDALARCMQHDPACRIVAATEAD